MNYTHLTEDERYHIDEMLRQGYLQSEIAASLGRSSSTLSRELNRNKRKHAWRSKQANELALERLKQRGAANAPKIDDEAWTFAKRKIEIE